MSGRAQLYGDGAQLSPENGSYWNNRGNAFIDMGAYQLAIDDLTTALGLEPYTPTTRLALAQAHEALHSGQVRAPVTVR